MRRVLWATIAVFVLLFVTNGVPFIYSDGYYYFHGAKSIINEGSFVSVGKPEYFDYRGHAIAYYQGKYVEVVSPGGALFILPGLAIASLLRSPDQTIYTDYFLAFNGHTLVDGLAVLITATLFGLASLVLIYRALRHFGFSMKMSASATGMAYVGSHAVWYVFLAPAFTHTYEVFAAALMLWGYAKYFQLGNKKSLFYSGIGIALLFLLRPIFALWGVALGGMFLLQNKWQEFRRVFLPSIPALLLWMWYNNISYGSPFTSGYTQIRGELFSSEFNAHNVLLSPERGWLIYSPIFALSIVGFILLWRKSRTLASLGLVIIFSTVLVYGFWGAWWGGGSFGQRFLLPLVPIGAWGLAYCFHYFRKTKWWRYVLALAIVLVSWSLLLTLLYRFTPVAQLKPVEARVGSMYAADRYTPLDMLSYHKDLLAGAESIPDYLQALYRSGNGGASIAVILAGASDVVLRLDERSQGELKFIVLAPPIMSQSMPESINGYLLSELKEVYSFSLANLEDGKEYIWRCSDICVGDDIDSIIEPAEEYPKELDRRNHTAINPANYGFELYFERPRNMQIKGPPIDLPVDAQFYSLP